MVPCFSTKYMCGGNVDRDSRKINQLNLPTIGVSSAWWPRSLRRCIATGEASQRRRALIMRGWWHSRSGFVPYHYLCLWLYLSGIFTILVGGVLLAVFVFGPWVTLLVLYAIWMLVAALALCFMIAGAQHAHNRRRVSSRYVEKTLPESIAHAELQFPTTPMPDAPLVRVLKTVDLSSSGIEHFLDAAMTKSLFEIRQALPVEHQLPQSHLAFPEDEALPQSQIGDEI